MVDLFRYINSLEQSYMFLPIAPGLLLFIPESETEMNYTGIDKGLSDCLLTHYNVSGLLSESNPPYKLNIAEFESAQRFATGKYGDVDIVKNTVKDITLKKRYNPLVDVYPATDNDCLDAELKQFAGVYDIHNQQNYNSIKFFLTEEIELWTACIYPHHDCTSGDRRTSQNL